jgi:hypothetical protein
VWAVAMPRVIPITDIDGSVWTVLKIDTDVLGVITMKDIISSVNGVKSTSGAVVDLMVDAVTVKIMSEKMISVLIWPVVTEIDHRSNV